MSLAMISVFLNLVVITSIRRREEMVSVTFNLVKHQSRYNILLLDAPPNSQSANQRVNEEFKMRICQSYDYQSSP